MDCTLKSPLRKTFVARPWHATSWLACSMVQTDGWLATGASSANVSVTTSVSGVLRQNSMHVCSWPCLVVMFVCDPPVQTCTHELGHVHQRVLVRDRASHATRCAIQQDQERDGRLLVTVFPPNEEQDIQPHMMFMRFRDLSSPEWIVLRHAMQHKWVTPTSEWQIDVVHVVQPLLLWDLSVLSSLSGPGTQVASLVNVSFGVAQLATWLRFLISGIMDTSSGDTSSRDGTF